MYFISFQAVPKLYQNGPDFAYNVSFRKPGSQWKHEVVEEKESYTISNAGVDQLWEFRVQSKNSQGNGPECQIKEARTAREGMETSYTVLSKFVPCFLSINNECLLHLMAT